jgi:Methyltransferase domain
MPTSEKLIPDPETALQMWAEQVRANRDQADAYREGEESNDFYAPIASQFAADPHRTGEDTLELLKSLGRPDDVWMDIGAGGGRYALPLALQSKEVIAVEPSDGMLDVLNASAAEHNIRNLTTIVSRWPMENAPEVDISLISHVGYDIENIGPFLEAMESSSRRLCIAILLDRAPSSLAAPLWPAVHGVVRNLLPGLSEFLAVQMARGRLCEVRLSHRDAPRYETADAPLKFMRQQMFVRPDGEKDLRLQAELKLRVKPDGDKFMLNQDPMRMGIVSWEPPR